MFYITLMYEFENTHNQTCTNKQTHASTYWNVNADMNWLAWLRQWTGCPPSPLYTRDWSSTCSLRCESLRRCMVAVLRERSSPLVSCFETMDIVTNHHDVYFHNIEVKWIFYIQNHQIVYEKLRVGATDLDLLYQLGRLNMHAYYGYVAMK